MSITKASGCTIANLDPMVVLRDTSSLFRRKAEMYRALHVGCNGNGGEGWRIRCDIYQHEADRLDDLISLCDGTATSNASADTLPVAAETIDGAAEGVVNEQT